MRRALLLTLFFFTGATALGYQLLWTRVLSNILGHEMRAVVAVVSGFMAGMALGAWLLRGTIQRSNYPGRWYAGLEILVGIFAVMLPVTTPWVMIPAVIAIGASFPAMVRFVEGQGIAALYAANTLGAVVGVIVTAWTLLPQLGLSVTGWVLGVLNIAVGVFAWWFAARRCQPCFNSGAAPRRPLITILITGFLSIGFEILGVRVLSQVTENTVYSFAAALAVYLLGTSVGAAFYHRFGNERWLNSLLGWTAVVCLGSVFVMSRAQGIFNLFHYTLAAEMAVAVSVFLLPTICMGALFSLLVQRLPDEFPKMLAVNVAGSALAPFLVGVLLLPAIGTKWALIIVSVGYVALMTERRWLAPIAALALIPLTPQLRFVQAPPGGSILDYREGSMASVAVVRDAVGHRTLKVNNRFQMGGTSAAATEYRQAHFPLRLHPNPRRALFLGTGTGITFGAATLYTELEADGVELLPEVVAVMDHFKPENFLDAYGTRLRMHIADARRFVRSTPHSYDVIVADLFHPARDGAATLYTKEHFAAVGARLNKSGIFCQWLPLHQMDEAMLRSIIRTFLEAFPNARSYLLHWSVDVPVLGLFGTEDWHGQAERVTDDPKMSGGFIAGPDALRKFSSLAPLNTDDHQFIAYAAARFAYKRKGASYEGLLAALGIERAPTDFLKARNKYLQGLVQESQGRMDEAIDQYLESAVVSDSFTMGYSRCISLAAAMAKERPDAARALLARVVEAKPNEKLAHDLLQRLFPPAEN